VQAQKQLPRPRSGKPFSEPQEGIIQKARHARSLIDAERQLFGGCVEVVRRSFDAGVALDKLKNVEQAGMHVAQLGLCAIASADMIECPLDQAERLIEGVVEGARHAAEYIASDDLPQVLLRASAAGAGGLRPTSPQAFDAAWRVS
jgi:hypothetical protein